MKTPPKNTSEDHRMYEVLIATFEYGDVTSVAHALGIPQQHVDEMKAGRRRGPFEAAAIITEQLRRNGNENADQPFLELARRLGFTATRQQAEDAATEGRPFSAIMKEVSDVASAFDALHDDERQAGERAVYARQLHELAEAATAEARKQQRLAETEASNVRRMR